jgi:hypothetical protein
MSPKRGWVVRVLAVVGTAVAAVVAGSGCTRHTGTAAVGGSVPVHHVSAHGPFEPEGPLAATSMAALLDAMRAQAGGRPVVCDRGERCWADAPVPADSLLIAVTPAVTSCFSIRSVSGSLTAARTLRVDVTVVNGCDPHGGSAQAARKRADLLAVPLARLPGAGPLTVVVRGRAGGGGARSAATELGRVSVVLPGSARPSPG